ncbi:MAG: CRISPR-associated protein Cas5 [Thermofilaceae archaeon]|nr:CRISPR-associated protein Cas5 [Thermofilaceae archaeon]MCX8179958.1 CRISPR-associated protein Cas5 [Thermofilaceae archaeon]MDW8004736.1 CRISPR-associated protein Cas5 [Thermofilaceae archaeon]
MKALTFVVRFTTAQFKDHMQKLVRRTYLIPPPSAVAGFYGAILGLSRSDLKNLSKKIWAGAELRRFDGRGVSLARLFKFSQPADRLKTHLEAYFNGSRDKEILKEIQGLQTIKESEELFMPEYKFAIASTNEKLIDEGLERIRNYDFEYEVYGGNDYHFVEYISDPRLAQVSKSLEGCGYCPREDFEHVLADQYSIVRDIDFVKELTHPIVIPVMFLADVRKEFIQVYGAKIRVKRELDAVDDGESKIFVYNLEPFFVTHVG